MNRENMFRGKRTDTKEWVYGNLLKFETDYFTDSNDTGFMWYIIPLKTNGSWSKEKLMLKFISPCFEVIPETVGQYTGLKDKNGKEIYEGDIIQDERGEKYLIKWGINSNGFIAKTNEAHCNVYSSYHLSFKTQVIGNIYENPELLEVANGQH